MKQRLLIFFFLVGSQVNYGQSPYVSKVYDYMPAPGQFVNELPEYEAGDTKADMIRKVEECIVGEEKMLISLGGYGGYVLFGFDHMVENKRGKYDFKIWGNAFYANTNPNPGASTEGGSCEPGIVMVSYDANANGLPDDEWYELAGSEYYRTQTAKQYGITYYKPTPDKLPTPDDDYPFLNDTTYIRWESNRGEHGYVVRNTFHNQSYYPGWISDSELTFEGTKLADNYLDESGNGSYFVQYAYRWGYADNHPNNSDRSCFDISWAVDTSGNLVRLPGIHFVKVYTGVNQYCGWLGETSTEIMGAEDLHLQGKNIDVPVYTEGIKIETAGITMPVGERMTLRAKVYSSCPDKEQVSWKSEDENIVTVDSDGNIVSQGKGETCIVATTANEKYRDTCRVTVSDEQADISAHHQEVRRAYCNGNTLYIENMDQFWGTILSINGIEEGSFVVNSASDVRPLSLSPGVYFLKAQKQSEMNVFRFVIF